MPKILPLAGVLLERSALATGFVAAAIAVGGFLARSRTLLSGASEMEIQRHTAIGGLSGFLLSVWLILLDTLVS